MLLDEDLVDTPFRTNCPTWLNGRKGRDFIGKCIDHFVVSMGLRSKMKGITAYAEDLIISDHRPISLLWDFEKKQEGFPFKFNSTWLKDDSLNKMV